MMNGTETTGLRRIWRQVTQEAPLWLFAVALTIILTAVYSFNLVLSPQVSVTLGEPAAEEVLAPRSISFYSEVLTEQAREQAQARVADVYSSPDVSIARAQLNKVRSTFSFIEVVRADNQADLATRLRYLSQIEGVNIEPELAELLLGFTSDEFLAVRNDIDRFSLARDVIDRVPHLGQRAAYVRQLVRDLHVDHGEYIRAYGDDMPLIKEWVWGSYRERAW